MPTAYVLAASQASKNKEGVAFSAIALGATGSLSAGVPAGLIISQLFGWNATFLVVAAIMHYNCRYCCAFSTSTSPVRTMSYEGILFPSELPCALALLPIFLIMTGIGATGLVDESSISAALL